MAKTLLNACNETLKRVNVIAGDSALFTSLTDSAQQHSIDIAVQVINEGIDKLYTASHIAMPKEQSDGTMTLVTGTREYTLATDLIQLRWPMIDRTNSQYIWEYTSGYDSMLLLDPEQDDTGLPHWGVISPVNGKIHLERAPDAPSNGRVYHYQYDKDLGLSGATDTVPFSDATFRAMVPVWAQLWKREMRNEFDQSLYSDALGRAALLVTERLIRTSYSPR